MMPHCPWMQTHSEQVQPSHVSGAVVVVVGRIVVVGGSEGSWVVVVVVTTCTTAVPEIDGAITLVAVTVNVPGLPATKRPSAPIVAAPLRALDVPNLATLPMRCRPGSLYLTGLRQELR